MQRYLIFEPRACRRTTRRTFSLFCQNVAANIQGDGAAGSQVISARTQGFVLGEERFSNSSLSRVSRALHLSFSPLVSIRDVRGW